MGGSIIFILVIVGLVLFVFIIRLLGAWLFRINEVIVEMKTNNFHLTQIKNDINFMRNQAENNDSKP
jgi:uncharacterized membrane-anchored protein YhcB (DUF1043 family)